MPINAGLFSSHTPEWATPQKLFDKLSREFRCFDLDVCATATNAKCERYYTRTDNGLAKAWARKNWMNPPYGREIARWVERAHTEACRGNLTVALLPARTDTSWFQNYIYRKHHVRFLRGRLRFDDGPKPARFPR